MTDRTTGTLYIVATPIGNLDDISKRALSVLNSVDIILAEDTRRISILLRHYDIDKHTLSYHQHSDERKKLEVLSGLLEGKNVALVTEAGTPGISDPGNELIDYLLQMKSDIKVIPIPGASALTAALSICGFRVNNFIFLGYFPKKKVSKIINMIKDSRMTSVFFDSPKRVVKTLRILADNLGGERRVFIGRELTKIHEIYYRGKLRDIQKTVMDDHYLKGELVIVLEGKF